jgi:uncharacterized protein YfcZ (UPF0381/DUF406 family)
MNLSKYYTVLIWIGILLIIAFVVMGLSGILGPITSICGVVMSLAGSIGAYIDGKEKAAPVQVFILFECDGQDSPIVGVFSSREKAEEVLVKYEKRYLRNMTSESDAYEIEVYPVDGDVTYKSMFAYELLAKPLLSRRVIAKMKHVGKLEHPPLDLDN